MVLPILRSNPVIEVGTPVSRANFCLACIMPNALFREKLRPGIIEDFLAMIKYFFYGFSN